MTISAITMQDIQNSSADELVIASTPAAGVRVLALNRPSKRNALSGALISDFLEKLSAAAADAQIGAIIITGTDTCFSGTAIFHLDVYPRVLARSS